VLLPNAQHAVVPDAKVRDYLLSLTHPQGAPKARFLMQFGFTQDRWEVLADALLLHARQTEATPTARSEFGQKYTTHGTLACPDGRIVNVRVAWIVLVGDTVPRVVTVVPGLRS